MRILFPALLSLCSLLPALPSDAVDTFVQVYEIVKNNYIEEIDEATLIEYAIEGLIKNLDPHCDYMGESSHHPMSLDQHFGGVGLELAHDGEHLEILSVTPSSPAKASELSTHDKILMIDEVWTKGLGLREAAEKIQGPVGTSVELVVLKKNAHQPEKISLKRQWIHQKTVSFKQLDDIAYLRIEKFSDKTSQDFQSLIQEYQIDNNHFSGLVLDLRDNPGGLVKSASTIANSFLDAERCAHLYPNYKNLIVYSEGRRADFNLKEDIQGPEQFKGLPVVVLINEGSASAAEILAGALQDYHRAIIVGQQSFGKGSVQTVIPIKNSFLKITCSRYFTPSGRGIQASGIGPDITLEGSWKKNQNEKIHFSEKNLNHHLKNVDHQNPAKIQSCWDNIDDPFLIEARYVLKTLSVAEKNRLSESKVDHI